MTEIDQKELLKRSMLVIKKLEDENQSLRANIQEPIAIIGMACRLPGNVNNPEDFWDLLIQNKDAIIDVPSNRWSLDQYYDPDKDAPGKMYVKKGGFLQTPIDEFDADFFHISPKEAEDMDPQQRLALEVAVEAIQSAGINSTDLMRSLTGVYMGICFNDYGHLITESGHVEAVDNYYSTGNHYSVLSGRISYFFGLQGPAISMDTACSSSLVSIDTAVKDLRLKRCNLALAGGVNLMLAPEPTINFCKSGMLSPEGHCKTFDESADGYVRGEGCGIIILKRLSDAIKDNNTILAVIRGTAVNQDGPSSGLTVPNGLAQEAVIKAALENAKVSPEEIQYVEAHGTGTSLGDPIEVEALKNSYTKGRDENHPLRVGSVKTNIGHTEAVAGVASVMKVVLSFLHEKIPATLHFKKLNPKIALNQIPLKIAGKNLDWKREENTKRLAGVSSFGFSGTNAHIILEESPALSAEQFELWKIRTEEKPQFHRQAYWAEAARPNAQQMGIYVHPLLGEMHELPDKTAYFTALLQLSTLSYLEDHVVFDRVIYPGAAYLEMALSAGSLLLGNEKIALENVSLESVLQFEAGKTKKTQMLIKKLEAETYSFEIYSQVEHAKGKITALIESPAAISLENIKDRCPEALSISQFYEAIKTKGIAYGPHFQCIQNLSKGNKEVFAELQLKGSAKSYHMHPALLDCALQLVFANFSENGQFNLPAVLLPISCEKFQMYSDLGEKIWAHLSLLESTESITVADIRLLNSEGRVLADIKRFHYRPTSLSALENVLENEKRPSEAVLPKKIAKTNLVLELESAEASQRLSIIKNYLKDLVRRVLGKSPSETIEDNKGFFDMGFDSMMVVEFEEHLEDALGKGFELPSSLLFDRPNIEKMTEYLAEILKIDMPNATKKIEVQAPLSTGESIAIIGMSCRFPGGANSVDDYWKLLERGGDAIREIPKNRWDADNYFDPDPDAPGKMISKLGGFLNIDVSEFDASFFGISPREAEYLDPQQRLLLEVSYEALQSTGLDLQSLRESLTAVFVGICTQDYMDLLTATGDKTLISPWLATGNMASTASGRLSYFYGFQGPNFPIDTACSSSLVAIHQACESLRNGEANLALAGGVNLILAPDLNIDFSKAGMLASDGHCKTFDVKADGYVRGEGCGIIVLKRLSDAQRDGDTILAVIKASSINQDGASSGLTVPNGDAQEKLIRRVISKAQLKGADIDYLEAHGTGTSLGDPIEVRAIGATYGERDSNNPLKLGSVKTNIGHLEGAAGIASVIKVILALQHEMLPKHLNFTKLNPHIALNFPAEIVTENKEWKRGERIRRAAVSSFGFSGTNAHLILEEAAPLSDIELEEMQRRLEKIPQFKRQRYWIQGSTDIITEQIPEGDLLNQLEKIPENEKAARLRSYVADLAKSVLRLLPSEVIDENKGFFDIGFDSLMAVELRDRLQIALGKTPILSSTLVFDHSNIDALVKYLGGLLEIEGLEIKSEEEALEEAKIKKSEKIREEISELSDEEAKKLLFEELNKSRNLKKDK